MIDVMCLGKSYDGTSALTDVSFSLRPGERVGLVGVNGAGKTTLLRVLAGASMPTSGSVTIFGADVSRDREHVAGMVGFLPEIPPLYPDLTVHEFLQYVLALRGFTNTGTMIDVALHAVDMMPSAHRRIGTLSLGQRKRVGIAQAFVHRPKLLLLDEPGSGLDPIQLDHLRTMLRRLHGMTLLISSHLLGEVQETCDRVLLLHEGRLVEDISLQAMRQRCMMMLDVISSCDAAMDVLRTMPECHVLSVMSKPRAASEIRVVIPKEMRTTLLQHLITSGVVLESYRADPSELGDRLRDVAKGRMPVCA
jgi:ABC-2 type transport system ATP-binding protein